MIEAVIFDYGGVIATPMFHGLSGLERQMGWPAGSLAELLFGTGSAANRDSPPDGIADDDPPGDGRDWHRLETGLISLDEYVAGLTARAEAVLGQPFDAALYEQLPDQFAITIHWMVVHKARELRDAGYRMGLLTNNVREWAQRWRASFPVDEIFSVVVDSSEVGLRKPDARIYELTCEQLDVAPTSAVFIDDSQDNLETAAALGMETVQFGDDPWAALAALDEVLAERGKVMRS